MPRFGSRTGVPTLLLAALLVPACDPSGLDGDLDGFERIPPLEELVWGNVRPAATTDYWELRFAFLGMPGPLDVVGSGGSLTRDELPPGIVTALDATTSQTGFAVGCLPAFCFHYIAAVTDSAISVYATMDDLRQFLGDIDAVEEAALLVRGLGYTWSSTESSSGYQQRRGGSWDFVVFELVNDCAPVQIDRVLLRVEATGAFGVLDREVWEKSENACI